MAETGNGIEKWGNRIDLTDWLSKEEVKKFHDTLKDSSKKEKLLQKLNWGLESATPPHVRNAFEDAIKKIEAKWFIELSDEDRNIINTYNSLFGGSLWENIMNNESNSEEVEENPKEQIKKALEEAGFWKTALLIEKFNWKDWEIFLEKFQNFYREFQNKLSAEFNKQPSTQNNNNETNTGNDFFKITNDNLKIENNFFKREDNTGPKQIVSLFRKFREKLQNFRKWVKDFNKDSLDAIIRKVNTEMNNSFPENDIDLMINSFTELYWMENLETEKEPTVDNVLGVDISDLEITWAVAYKLQQIFSKVWLQNMEGKPRTDEWKKALINAFKGIINNWKEAIISIYPDHTAVIEFNNDVLILDKEFRGKLERALNTSSNGKDVSNLITEQMKKVTTTAELLWWVELEGTTEGEQTIDHPLKWKEKLVNTIDNAINTALESDLPNLPIDIRRNMATSYTIAMLDYVWWLSPEKQSKLANDLEPKWKNIIEWVLNIFKRLKVNPDVGEFFTKYDKFNIAIERTIPKDEMKDKSELKKYKILGDTTAFVEAFKSFDGKTLDMEKGNDEAKTNFENLGKLLNSKNIKGISPKVMETMDSLAKGLNSVGKDINSIKSMLESGEYTDTIESLLSIPILGDFLKGFIDMGMKLLGYKEWVSEYLDKMNDKALKKTSEFIIKDLSSEKNRKLNKGIFKDVKGIVTKGEGDKKTEIHLHKWFIDWMEAFWKDFKNNDEVEEFLNSDGLNRFIDKVKGINNSKINPDISKLATEVVDGDKKINLSNLSNLVKIYGEFTTEKEKIVEKWETGFSLEKFLEDKYPAKKKTTNKTEITNQDTSAGKTKNLNKQWWDKKEDNQSTTPATSQNKKK